MVGEFPELQGLMGRYYAAAQGEAPAVAAAVEDHYRPQGPSDRVPTDPVSVAVALADKLDTLVGFWAIDEKPTGSKDPFALRRAALGVIRIVIENGLRLRLLAICCPTHAAAPAEPERATSPGVRHAGRESMASMAFFADRLKVYLRDKGARHDLIDAVFALPGQDDLVLVVRRVEALGSFLDTEDGRNLLAGYRRAANILKAEEKRDGAGAFAALARPDAARTPRGARLGRGSVARRGEVARARRSRGFRGRHAGPLVAAAAGRCLLRARHRECRGCGAAPEPVAPPRGAPTHHAGRRRLRPRGRLSALCPLPPAGEGALRSEGG